MYNIDINLLNGRPGFEQDIVIDVRKKPPTEAINPIPLLIGGGVAVIVNVLVLGVWFFLQNQNAAAEAKLNQITQENQNKDGIAKQIDAINAQASEVRQEADALATVFNQIKPWSALIQDLSDRIPGGGLQVVSVIQTEPSPVVVAPPTPASASPSPSPSGSGSPAASPASPPPTSPPKAVTPSVPEQTAKLEIQGFATSFDQVNDFILLLQTSPFFSAKETRLIAATSKDNPTQIQLKGAETSGTADLPKLKPVVEYKIETALSNTPASDLLNELQEKESDGLVVRIQTLVEKGIITPKK